MKNKCCNKNHPDHSEQLKNLNRVLGQVEGIRKMINDNRYCPDILTQLKAVRSALKTIETKILQKHLEGCVTTAMKSSNKEEAQKKIDELTEIFKRFEG